VFVHAMQLMLVIDIIDRLCRQYQPVDDIQVTPTIYIYIIIIIVIARVK
jgi:hypothetical protein